jgi:integrase
MKGRDMATGTINIPSVAALECPEGKDRGILWDDSLRGFGVVAFRNGGKCYVVQYRQHGRSHRARIGDHPALTPNEARKLARKLLGAVEGGADPIEERRKAREVPTFATVAGEFLNQHVATKRKDRTGAEYKRILESLILPSLGAKRIVDLRQADVGRMHSKLAAKPYQANRALALVSAIWNWAAKRDEVAFADNPAKAIERFPERSRERFLQSDELARLGAALAEGESVGLPYAIDETKPNSKHAPKPDMRRTKLAPFAVAAIRLLILTGARLREILNARWEHVDLERGILFLPDSKTGRKPLYLSAAAQSVLASIVRVADNPHIIAGALAGAPRADLNKPWRAVARAAGLTGVRLHDLRHSFASFGAGASLGLPILGKLLGHSQAATTQRYAHLDADPMRRAVETIGATISAAMAGQVGGEVVPIKARVNR